MAKPTTEPGLSPLDQVRQIEAEVTRRIAAARVSAGRSVAIACSDAVQLRQAARQAGKAEGQARYEEIVLHADQESGIIVAQAREEAQDLEQKGRSRMEMAVGKAVAYVLGKALDGVDG